MFTKPKAGAWATRHPRWDGILRRLAMRPRRQVEMAQEADRPTWDAPAHWRA